MNNFLVEEKERLDKFLAKKLPNQSRSKVAQFIQKEGVKVSGVVVNKPGFDLKEGDQVEIGEVPETPPHDLTPVQMELDVRFEDEHLLVINKRRGLAVHPAANMAAASLVNGLLARSHELSSLGGEFRPGIVHRLDKNTTGLIVVAKSDLVHRGLQDQIKTRRMGRRYVAVARGNPDNERFTIDAPIGRDQGTPTMMAVKQFGKEAVTHVQVMERYSGEFLCACRLETGRTHQIRVHLAHFQFPIQGDNVYCREEWGKGSMQLHAAALGFEHPVTKESVDLFVEPPEDFRYRERVSEEGVLGWN